MSLKSDTKGVYDFDLSASSYNYLQDILLNPFTVDGDGCRLFPERQDHAQGRHQLAECRRQGHLAAVRLSTARRRSASASTATAIDLENPVFARRSGTPHRPPAPVSFTRTASAKPAPARCGCRTPGRSFPNLKLTLGGRLETWQALDGFKSTPPQGRHRRPITAVPASRGSRISPDSTRPISRQRRRCPTIPTRIGMSPRISARPIAIRPSPNFTRT